MKRSIKERIRKLLNTNASNREIALGIAVGVFVSFSPLYGLQMLLCLFLVLIFKRLNKVAVFIGVQLSWLYPPMLYLDYLAGRYLMPGNHPSLHIADFGEKGFKQLWELLKQLFPVLLVGSVLVGGIAGVIAYLTVMMLMRRYRREVKV